MLLFVPYCLATYSVQAGAITCGDLLLRGGQFALALTGRSLMQEGTPIARQLLARDYPFAEDLAWAWQDREEREHNRRRSLLVHTSYWGPSNEAINFIQSVPNWERLTNGELRALTAINFMVSNYDFFKEDRLEIDAFADDIRKWKDRDIARWTRLFPLRPIPEEVLALRNP